MLCGCASLHSGWRARDSDGPCGERSVDMSCSGVFDQVSRHRIWHTIVIRQRILPRYWIDAAQMNWRIQRQERGGAEGRQVVDGQSEQGIEVDRG